VKRFVYKKWDGSQSPFSLKRKDIVDTFMDNLMKGMSPNMSLAQMLWEGFQLQGMDFRVMGLEEMLDELEKQKQNLFDTYHLENSFDQPMDDLKYLLAEEEMIRRQQGAPLPPSYEELPPGLLEKINQLTGYPFKSRESRNTFKNLKKREKDIFDLYEFYSRYSEYFKGNQSLDFDQAVNLMRLFESIDQTRQQILTGQFTGIDPNVLRELLGDQAEQSFNILLQIPEMISDEGIVRVDNTGFNITPRGMRALGQLAFGKTFHHIRKDREGGYQGNAPQTGDILPDSSRPYEFGDRFDLDITRTILESVKRNQGVGVKIDLRPDDFYVREREQRITSTTVLLLDLSWSMSWEGRFEAGKRVALALDHYIRTRFPRDKIHIIGFSTVAKELKGDALALAVWDAQRPYTNLQDGLRLAMRLIKKSGNRNNRVIVITDGQPTAYYRDEHLHVELPDGVYGISPNACKATLEEVRKVTVQGMNIDTFMLDDNPVLIEFTKQIAKINRGRAIMCLPGELGELIIVEEVKRRGGKI